MTKNEAALAPEQVRKLFSYCPLSGAVRWRQYAGGRTKGMQAGRVQSGGYLRVQVAQRGYAIHRIAWCLATGSWPVNTIDHKNGRMADNRIENLREATLSQNGANRRRSLNREYLYPRGVRFHEPTQKFFAVILAKHLGTFDTVDEAAAAYATAARQTFGEFARTD